MKQSHELMNDELQAKLTDGEALRIIARYVEQYNLLTAAKRMREIATKLDRLDRPRIATSDSDFAKD